ncbi:heterokaryon incompatibility protein-domain-containing protein [Alternaria rosae]|uniref:heterokaryon incompatibility protein-domain-containing protein n=1 Tax=Alternaria rosae TaxID=1187941 RepID=UPI001E8EB53F|nr:heterokaryon incompatibility protein-domain-containing protein [Alternaria rosae]KAH6883329.1 heterokaryon incompatibility protein-domain-containing protein [Alternaria rosae]
MVFGGLGYVVQNRAMKALRARSRQASSSTGDDPAPARQSTTSTQGRHRTGAGYEYRPLLASGIVRVLVLRPYEYDSSESIKCDVRHTRILTGRYCALSYEWGPPADDDPKIRLDGHLTVVRRNLFQALLSLRRRWQYEQPACREIWIDALSINQADMQERNHQVQLMSTIYRRAIQVLVWPGYSECRNHHAIAVINIQNYGNYTDADEMLESVPPLLELCLRSYWNRVWIQQELYLARHILIMWGGDKYIRYESFDHMLALITRSDSPVARDMSEAIEQSAANAIVTRKRLSIDSNTLVTWLRMACQRGLETSEPRDLIYAMLGISSDCQIGGLEPDYGKPLLDVYLETIVFCGLDRPGLENERFRQTLAEYLGLLWNDGMEMTTRKYCATVSGPRRQGEKAEYIAGPSTV